MLAGKTVDPIKASKIGFSFLFMGEERKLAKMYHDKGGFRSYNISVIANKSNTIVGIEIYEVVQTGTQGAEVRRIQNAPPSVALEMQKDLQEITTR